MSDETSSVPAVRSETPNPVDRYSHGDPGQLAEAMLAPGERPPDIEPEFLDADALKVIRGLRTEGFLGYLVGGCVRDLLVGMSPKDFDIATSAHPGEMRSLFRNCRLIGRRFRLAHVYFRGGKIIEVATFRKSPRPSEQAELDAEAAHQAEAHLHAETDGKATPHDELEVAEVTADAETEVEVEAAGDAEVESESEASPDLLITEDNTFGTAEEDARRRDFTVNGLFYDVVLGRVLDYVGGLRDLDRGLIRTIGDPEVRMREDPVRLLRAVRFACKLGFEIEPNTYAACEGSVEDLQRCAPPRLLEEIFKILRAGASAPSFELLDALGATPVLLAALHQAMQQGGPELVADRQRMLSELDAQVRERGAPEDSLLFAALLEPIARRQVGTEQGGPEVLENLLDELVRGSRLPRRIADRVRHLLAAQKTLSGERKRRRSLASFRRTPYFEDALTLYAWRVAATGESPALLEKWRSGEEPELGADVPAEAAPATADGGPRRKRRRRRRGGNGASTNGAAKPAENPAGGEG